jgi:hypothetical protein
MTYLPDIAFVAMIAVTLIAALTRRAPSRVDGTVLVLFLLTAVSIFYPNYANDLLPSRSLVATWRLREVLFVAALALLAVDLARGRCRLSPGHTWMPLLVFYALALVAGAVGWLGAGIAVTRVLRDLHPLLFVALGALVPAVVASRRQLDTWLRLLGVFSVLVIGLTPLQIALAPRQITILPGMRPEAVGDVTLLVGWSWAGLSLANAFVFAWLYRLLAGPRLAGGSVLAAGAVSIGVAIVLGGFARMNWIAHALAAGVVLVIAPLRIKLRFAAGLAGTAVAVVLVVGVASVLLPGPAERTLNRIQFLFSTMLDPSEYRSTAETGERTSIGRRLMENGLAWAVFARNPVLGAGPGYKYWQNVDLYTARGDRVSLRNIHVRGGAYIHSSWLWLLSKIGLPGTLAFAWAMAAPLVAGLVRLHALPLVDQAVVLGLTVRGLALLAEAVGHPYFFTVSTAAGLGVMVGTVRATIEIGKEGASDAQRVHRRSVLQRSVWHSLPLGATSSRAGDPPPNGAGRRDLRG